MSGFGRGRSSSDADVGLTGGTNSNNQRASVMGVMPEHGWATGTGGRFGVVSGSATVRIGFGTVDGSGQPSTRVNYGAAFTVNNVAVDATTCQKYTSAMSFTQMWAGTTYYVCFAQTGAQLYHQMAQSANVSYTNEDMYFKSTSSSIPTNPFAADSIGYSEGIITIYIEYEPNVAPNTPSTGLAPTGFASTLTPTFTANFVDDNTDVGDSLNQYQIEVRASSTTGVLKWSSGSIDATSGEQSSGAVSKVYGGATLVAGTTYYWKIRVSDQFNTWSNWSAWQSFTVNAGGTVSTPTAPTGIQQTVTPGPFTATWSHGSALSTSNVEITLYNAATGGTVLRGPKQVAKVVANGGTISLTWADTAFANLSPGVTYYTTIRAQDSGGLWSPPSARTAFSINAYPTVPALQSPADNAAIAFRPKLIAISTDADDTVATGFAVSVRIKNSAGTVLFTRAMTLNTGVTPNQWEYQTTSTDLASTGTYKWDAVATDGTFTTAYSAERTFIYGTGPVVTITAPTDGSTVTTNTPTITWTTTGQVKKQIIITNTLTGATVLDTGILTDAVASYTVPTGYLFNNTQYTFTVSITNSTPLTGSSLPTSFTVTYPAPATIANFIASPNVGGASALLTWEAPNDPPELFSEYTLTAKDLSTGVTDRIARLPSVAQTAFEYAFPKANTTYEFGISKTVYTGSLEKITSVPATSQVQVPFRFPCFTSVLDGGDSFVSLQLLTDFSADDNDDTEYVQTWADAEPTAVVGPSQYQTISATFRLITDQYGSARDKYTALKALRDRRTLVCYRDDRSYKVFGYMTLRLQYAELDRLVIDVELTQVNYKENVP